MASMRVKVLTDMRVKRKREGKLCYACTAINSESIICSISADKESVKHIKIDNFIVMKGHKLFSRDNVYFLKVCEDTKVCHIFFSNYISKLIGKFSSGSQCFALYDKLSLF